MNTLMIIFIVAGILILLYIISSFKVYVPIEKVKTFGVALFKGKKITVLQSEKGSYQTYNKNDPPKSISPKIKVKVRLSQLKGFWSYFEF